MIFFLSIIFTISFCSEYWESIDEDTIDVIRNMINGTHYFFDTNIKNRNNEIRFFFPKTNFTSNPNPFTIVYKDDIDHYVDKGILKTYQDSTKDYYIVYAQHYCRSYKYRDYCRIYFEVIPNKNISYCLVTLSRVDDTTVEGKIIFFAIIVFCIFISAITIIKTKACGDCGVKSVNPAEIQNVPFQHQHQPNIQNEELLIQP